jgi:hypothetical protein
MEMMEKASAATRPKVRKYSDNPLQWLPGRFAADLQTP